MRATILTILFACCFGFFSSAQVIDPADVQPEVEYENVHVKKIATDSNSSSFIIWIKKEVPAHRHNHHTEVVTIIQGAGTMVVDGESRTVKKGDIILIPEGAIHSVVVTSEEPLKVLSVQAPEFTGEDREWIK